MCVCKGERAEKIEYVLYIHTKTLLCGKKGKGSAVFYHIAYYMYVFGQCLVGFGCTAVGRPFEITEIIW